MMKKLMKTIFVTMLLLFAVPFGAFAANTTNSNVTTNNTIAVVVNTSLNMGSNSTINVTPVTNGTQIIPVTNTSINVTPVINSTINVTPVTNGTQTIPIVNRTSGINSTPVQKISQANTDEIETEREAPERIEVEGEIKDPENYEKEVPENETISQADKKYISDGIGVKLRLLELKNRVDFQAQAAAMILNKISALKRESSFNMTALTDAASNFESISTNIATTDLNSLSTTQIANLYASYKKEAIVSTILFKKTLAPGLTKTEKLQLKKILKRKYEAHKKIKDSKIEKLKSEFNNEKVKKVLKQFSMNNPNLVAKYKSGQISMDDLKKELRDKFDSMSKKDKEDLKSRIAESNKKDKVNFIKERENIKSKIKALRAEHRKKFEERKAEFKKKFEEKHKRELKTFEKRTVERENSIKEFEKKESERFSKFKVNQRNKFQEKKDTLRNKFQERRSNAPTVAPKTSPVVKSTSTQGSRATQSQDSSSRSNHDSSPKPNNSEGNN